MSDTKKVKLSLIGVDGNAFSVIGAFTRAAKKQGFDKEFIDSVVDEATSGDYNHLLATIIKNTH